MNKQSHNPALLSIRHFGEYWRWKIFKTSGAAPHWHKRKVIKDYAGRFGLKILVETGTYLGEMVEAMSGVFESIYSIELSHSLFEAAGARFAGRGHIHILEGDSGDILPKLLPQLSSPVLFWLDGHYSGGETAKGVLDTPVAKELEVIFRQCGQPFVILIDDARLFNGQNGYPELEELKQWVRSNNGSLEFLLEADIIRIYPKKQ